MSELLLSLARGGTVYTVRMIWSVDLTLISVVEELVRSSVYIYARSDIDIGIRSSWQHSPTRHQQFRRGARGNQQYSTRTTKKAQNTSRSDHVGFLFAFVVRYGHNCGRRRCWFSCLCSVAYTGRSYWKIASISQTTSWTCRCWLGYQ